MTRLQLSVAALRLANAFDYPSNGFCYSAYSLSLIGSVTCHGS
ncbi:hypothetical protein BFV94_2758 [Alteromonas macleodii]|uniref:Uncharacterized protein n=1 Tax=Alteromonas macleodii TaxID=28108 RepID=A0AB36FSS4_ALTMA|nr:hypothetical protein BFV93_2746 [Alteromonas macleodii]OES29812.1 hypothetical protein BFV94_2758 [Alteromonas macleodii]OES30394.1 hypothetical protein BFV95_2758 [Alteromonas macleodii]OES40513.1 hypothetical protein BFV96_2742 [Alteromonas macleodii]